MNHLEAMCQKTIVKKETEYFSSQPVGLDVKKKTMKWFYRTI